MTQPPPHGDPRRTGPSSRVPASDDFSRAGRRSLRPAILAALALGAVGVLAADGQPAPPATAPDAAVAADGRPGGPAGRGGPAGGPPPSLPGPRRWLGGPGGGPGGPPLPDPNQEVELTPAEQVKFEKFMEAQSPNKWRTFQAMQAMRPDSRRTKALRNGLAARYRLLQQAAAVDPARYQTEMAVIKIEDEVYGILQDFRKNVNPQEVDARLRDRAAALLDVRHKWRLERLRRVREELSDLRASEAANAVRREMDREENAASQGPGRKVRDRQIDQIVDRFKDSAKGGPRPNRAATGADRPDGGQAGEPAFPPDPGGPEVPDKDR